MIIKRFIFNFSMVLLLSAGLLNNISSAADSILIPASPRVAASSFILQDADSGKIVAEKNADQKLPPASLTKIMTVYVVYRELDKGHLTLDETVTISKKAWRTPGSRMFVEVNKQVSVEDLLRGVVIQSGNDAAVALAEHIAGDEATFAALMNQHAKRLGMLNTNFTDSTGLPSPDHYTTARDLAILTRALVKEFPDEYRMFSETEFTFNNITQSNRNKLLWRDDSVDGVKTGYTEAAGYCLVASAKRDGMRLISVVMGTDSVHIRLAESQSLLNYGFRFFETHRLYQGGQSLTKAKIWKGEQSELGLGLANDLYVTIPRRYYKDLQAVMSIDKKIIAPAEKGTQYGNLKVTLAGETVAQKPLVALNTIAEGGFFSRIYDEAMLRLE